MCMNQKIVALRMERQHLSCRATKAEYDDMYRDMQPGLNVYYNGFGTPPSLTYRADFNDMEYNQERQKNRTLLKGRFIGGNLGWIVPDDLELFVAAFAKPLTKFTPSQQILLDLIEREGALTIGQMKEETGMLVKEITPALHRLQKAFLIYEDQHDNEDWERSWYKFGEMFPDIDLQKYTRLDALKILLQRFAYRLVTFDMKMAKSYYKLSNKDIKQAIASLIDDKIITEYEQGYILTDDLNKINAYDVKPIKSVYAMHRNDILVKSNEHWLKEVFTHSYPDTLYYMLINGEFRGVVAGKFRYTPEVEDVIIDLPKEQANDLKDEILRSVHMLCGENNPIRRYQGRGL